MDSKQFVTRLAVGFFSVMCTLLVVIIFILRHRAMKGNQDTAKTATIEKK